MINNELAAVPSARQENLIQEISDDITAVEPAHLHAHEDVQSGVVAAEPVSTEASPPINTISDLIKDSVKQLGGLPLTTIVHGWGDQSAKQFLATMTPCVREIDSFILIPTQAQRTPPPPDLSRAVVLELDKKSHLWTYNNSIGDIVFFPAVRGEEVKDVAAFKQRAHVIVIDGRGVIAEEVKKAACANVPDTYLWFGEMALEKCQESKSLSLALLPSFKGEEQDLDSIGELLAGMATSLEQLHVKTNSHPVCALHQQRYPRPIFKSILTETIRNIHDRPSLSKDLVFQADKHRWPDWSVQCLPNFFIPLETLPGGNKKALVWHYILDCLPENNYRTIRPLCGEQFFEVRMTSDAGSIVEKVAQIFAETVQPAKCRTERAFFGEINEAMLRVKEELGLSDEEPRKEMLKQMAVGA